MLKNLIKNVCLYSFLILYQSSICTSFAISQAEIPVLADAPGNPQVMLLIDDSGSMNAVMEHPDFSATSAIATNTSLDIPSIIFRLESGAAAPATSQILRPVLAEVNAAYSASPVGTNTLFKANSFSSYASIPIIANTGCISASLTYTSCPSPGPSTPMYGPNALSLYGSPSIVGSTLFVLSNLAKSGGVNVTDSSGNEYLYTNFRKEDYFRTVSDWGDVWAKLDANGNPLVLRTRAFATVGGTVKFNNKEVFLSAGWYRIEYLRWIFYGATSQQLANLPGSTRIQTVKSVVSTLINNNPSVRWGLATLNGTSLTSGSMTGTLYDQWNSPIGTSSQTLPIIRKDIGSTNSTLLTSLATIGASGATPLTNRYIEILRYFNSERSNDPLSNRTYPSPITGSTAACDSYFIIVMTDGLPTNETANSVNGSFISDYDGDRTELPATSNSGCNTDAACSKWLDDAAYFAYNRDFSPSLIGTQNIRTYAVGLGVNYSLLDKLANGGGTGHSYLASSVQDISDTLTNIVSLIITSPIAGAGAALAETFGENGVVYRPRFRADTWVGAIDVFQYNTNTNNLDLQFEVGNILNQRDLTTNPRNIIAGLDSDGDGKTTQTIQFNVANASTLRPYLFQRIISGAEPSSNLENPIIDYTATASAEKVIRYINGESISGLRVRDRELDGVTDRLGDIVYSRPVEVGPRNGNYNLMNGYTAFTRNIQATQPRILLVGANDGMLHAFKTDDGIELWSYIPSSQLPYLERQTRMTYNAEFRRSYVDGPIDIEDVYVRGQWRTFAMFGLRHGGSTYTVLDITNRTSPTLVWEVSEPSVYGESWTKPAVVPVGSGSLPELYNWYMVVGTGANKTTTGTNLAIYDLSVGTAPSAIVKSISSSDPIGSRTSSINATQTDQDISVDRLYVGTGQGDMYRVQVSGAPTSWTVAKLFDGVPAQPLLSTPLTVIADNPQYRSGGTSAQGEPYAVGVYFGSGRYDTTTDITTVGATQQAIFGVFDPLRPDNDTYANVLTGVTTTNLQDQSPANYTAVRGADGIYRLPNSKAGFYIPLTTSVTLSSDNSFINPVGMVQYEPVNLRGALFFSTFLPDQSTCGVGGHSFLEGVNFRTGGGFLIDYSKDPRKPYYNGGIPDMNLSSTYDITDLSLAMSSKIVLPALDAKVTSINLTNQKPYSFDGILKQDDIRLHVSNGSILPAVTSFGNLGAPNPPVISQSFQKVIVQSAYPAGTTLGSAGSGTGGSGNAGSSGGSTGGTGSGGTGGLGGGSQVIPPPDMAPITIYNLPIDVLSFHEYTGD